MGPHPHLTKAVLEELEKTLKPEQVTEKIVTGKLMEAKGRLLQQGMASGTDWNMSVAAYRKRLMAWAGLHTSVSGPVVPSSHGLPAGSIDVPHEGGQDSGQDPAAGRAHFHVDAGDRAPLGARSRGAGPDGRPGEGEADPWDDQRGDECGVVGGRERGWSGLSGALNRLRSRLGAFHLSKEVRVSSVEVRGSVEEPGTVSSNSERMTRQGTTSLSTPMASSWGWKAEAGDPALSGQQSEKNRLWPSVTTKLARNAAVLGAMLLAPCQGLVAAFQSRPDFMEVACAPTSRLSSVMAEQGYVIRRINYKECFNLETRQGTQLLCDAVSAGAPRFMWVSLPCTRLSSLVHLTPRTAAEWAHFQRRQLQDLRRAREVSGAVDTVLRQGGDFAWEWPTGAKKGWDSDAINHVLRALRRAGRPAYWRRLDGRDYGLTFNGVPVRKGWTILTSCRSLWLAMQRRCPGHEEHA